MNIRKRMLKVANNLMEDVVKSFEMTEEEWKKYSEAHPNAKRENHQIVQNGKNQGGNGRKIDEKKIIDSMTDEQKKLHQMALCGGWHKPGLAAQNKKTHPITLDILSRDYHEDVRKYVALNPNTHSKTLEKMIENDKECRYRAVRNKNLSKNVIEKLSNSDDDYIRWGVADNQSTPEEVLEKLSKDENRNVRFGISSNKNSNSKSLDNLCEDEDNEIRVNVASHPNTSPETLEKMKVDKYTINAIVSNPNTSSKKIKQIYYQYAEQDWTYRAILRHKNTPTNIVDEIKNTILNNSSY